MLEWISSTTVISRAWISKKKRKEERLIQGMEHSDIYPIRKEKGQAGDLKESDSGSKEEQGKHRLTEAQRDSIS